MSLHQRILKTNTAGSQDFSLKEKENRPGRLLPLKHYKNTLLSTSSNTPKGIQGDSGLYKEGCVVWCGVVVARYKFSERQLMLSFQALDLLLFFINDAYWLPQKHYDCLS
ncbi:hypothetical protein CMV_010207 [Castanea mollissima]|uniref:Uncharacterized protein n=1 Tax=Castanea mollissima TaxID=60419 RepID=A0A8J4RJN2_9ROSI|nr:hypothetical protein CMV_010207 [Castanea mollissima]